MEDGHLNKCKVCTKSDVARHRLANIKTIREYDKNRSKLPHRIKINTENVKRFRREFPERYKAHNAVNNAVRDGRLIKPKQCQKCGDSGMIHGHHHDYSKPLEVEWLCPICHSNLKEEAGNA